jgi:hypothetical protein
MKALFLPLATAFGVVILMIGCSKPAPEPTTSAEKSAVGNGFQMALPSAFASKGFQQGGRCFIDRVNGQPVAAGNAVPANGMLTLVGWGIDVGNAAAPFVALELVPVNGSPNYYGPAQRATRPGLGDALKNPALDQAGLESAASLNGVPPGSYSLWILMGDGKTATRCDPTVLLDVK